MQTSHVTTKALLISPVGMISSTPSRSLMVLSSKGGKSSCSKADRLLKVARGREVPVADRQNAPDHDLAPDQDPDLGPDLFPDPAQDRVITNDQEAEVDREVAPSPQLRMMTNRRRMVMMSSHLVRR